MCPSGVDTSPVEEDFFGAGLFGGVQEDTAQHYNPDPVCEGGGFLSKVLSLPSIALPSMEPKVLARWAVGWVWFSQELGLIWGYPAFQDVLEARGWWRHSLLSIEVQQISRQFNTARYDIGLLMVGTILTGYGAVLSVNRFHDSDLDAGLGWNKRTVLVY